MKITLEQLRIENFKGIRKLAIDFGEVTKISGANATGKTTIYDAYLWLLFDKDSSGRSDFKLKPLNDDGSEKHNLDTIVEGLFRVDGRKITFKKVFSEKWTRKRGATTEEFTGHTTDYYIDDVPVKKMDYNDRLYELIEEKLFKLLSNPTYFSTSMKEADRREMLMKLIGDVDTDTILKEHKDLGELASLLSARSIEDVLKMQKATAKKINDELKEIPARVDELERSIDERDFVQLRKQREAMVAALYAAQSAQKTPQGVLAKMKLFQQNIETLQNQADAIKKVHDEKERAFLESLYQEFREAQNAEEVVRRDVIQASDRITHLDKEIARHEEDIVDAREMWSKIAGETYDGSDHCPTCGQPLPEERVKSAIEVYEKKKKQELEKIAACGESLKRELDRLSHELEGARRALAEKKRSLEEAQKRMMERENAYTQRNAIPRTEPAGLREIMARIETQREALQKVVDENAKQDNAAEVERIKSDLNQLDEQIAKESVNAYVRQRITELEIKKKTLGKDYETTVRIVALCEDFTRYKMQTISAAVDGQFSIVKWKLYEDQINGGMRDICKATVCGVPYEDANHAAKINAGIDIINTFSRRLGISIPIFVDNSESVNDIKQAEGQLIQLAVSKEKKLNVEVLCESKGLMTEKTI